MVELERGAEVMRSGAEWVSRGQTTRGLPVAPVLQVKAYHGDDNQGVDLTQPFWRRSSEAGVLGEGKTKEKRVSEGIFWHNAGQ